MVVQRNVAARLAVDPDDRERHGSGNRCDDEPSRGNPRPAVHRQLDSHEDIRKPLQGKRRVGNGPPCAERDCVGTIERRIEQEADGECQLRIAPEHGDEDGRQHNEQEQRPQVPGRPKRRQRKQPSPRGDGDAGERASSAHDLCGDDNRQRHGQPPQVPYKVRHKQSSQARSDSPFPPAVLANAPGKEKCARDEEIRNRRAPDPIVEEPVDAPCRRADFGGGTDVKQDDKHRAYDAHV